MSTCTLINDILESGFKIHTPHGFVCVIDYMHDV